MARRNERVERAEQAVIRAAVRWQKGVAKSVDAMLVSANGLDAAVRRLHKVREAAKKARKEIP